MANDTVTQAPEQIPAQTPEQTAAINPPVSKPPITPTEPQEHMWGSLPEYLQGLRARFAPQIEKVEGAAKTAAGVVGDVTGLSRLAQVPVVQRVSTDLASQITDPEKRRALIQGLPQTG